MPCISSPPWKLFKIETLLLTFYLKDILLQCFREVKKSNYFPLPKNKAKAFPPCSILFLGIHMNSLICTTAAHSALSICGNWYFMLFRNHKRIHWKIILKRKKTQDISMWISCPCDKLICKFVSSAVLHNTFLHLPCKKDSINGTWISLNSVNLNIWI